MSAMVIFGGCVSGEGADAQRVTYKRHYNLVSIRCWWLSAQCRLFIGWTSATDAWIYWEGLPDHGNLNVCRWFEWWVRVWSYMFTRWLSSHLITFVSHSVALSMPEIQNMRKLLLTRWKSWVVSINSLVSAKELGGKCWRYIYSCKERVVVVPVTCLCFIFALFSVRVIRKPRIVIAETFCN